MADNYLESRRDDYEKRKAEWLKRGKHFQKIKRKTQETDNSDK